MGRPKKRIYAASEPFLDLTEKLIRNYHRHKQYCQKYEKTHQSLIRKLNLQSVYDPKEYGYEEPFIQFYATESREKEMLEDYLDAKKKVFLLEHYIEGMEEEQMKAVASTLFLAREQQKNAEISVAGHIISVRTVCREKKRAISYLAWCIEGYAVWEAEALFA